MKLLIALLFVGLFGSTAIATTEDAETPLTDQEIIQVQMDLGALWAHNIVNGVEQHPEYLDFLKKFNRLVPLGVTVAETGKRTQTTLFRIEVSNDRLILLNPEKGRLQLLIGAPVSPEVMEAAHRNSAYLLADGTEGKEKFLEVFALVAKVDDKMKSEHGVSAFASRNTQDIFNRLVMQLGNKAAIFLELNAKLTADQLALFLTAINESVCENLLTQVAAK